MLKQVLVLSVIKLKPHWFKSWQIIMQSITSDKLINQNSGSPLLVKRRDDVEFLLG